MSIWQDKKTLKWRYKFMYLGEYHEAKGFDTMKRAQQEQADLKKALTNPAPPQEPVIVYESFRQLGKRYLEDCNRRMRKGTVRQKDGYLCLFADSMEHAYPAKDVTSMQVQQHINRVHDEHGAKLANRHLKEIRALFNWGFRGNGFPYLNPTAGIQKFPEDEYQRYNPPAEDVLAVIQAASPEETDILETFYFTAGRACEILRLAWDDVNLVNNTIILKTRKRRGGELATDILPMSPSLKNIMSRRWEKRDKTEPWVFINPYTGHRYHKDSRPIRHLLTRLCKRAKVKKFTFHCIRHHVATILRDSGKATLFEIQTMLRHRSPTTTQIYLKTTPVINHLTSILEGMNKDKKDT